MSQEESKGLQLVEPGEAPPVGTPYLVRPNDQLDVERRYAEESGDTEHALVVAHANVGMPVNYETETTDTTEYIGVSDEYMTHADDRQRPYGAEEGVNQVVEDKLLADENFGYAAPAQPGPSTQTVGEGSQGEHIVPGTSGERVSGLRVEPKSEDDSDGEPAGAPSDEVSQSEAPKVKAQRAPAKGTDKEASAST